MHMTVRIATYNLFEGASGSYNRLVEFVRTAALDIVCLQETNGWQQNEFARLKDFTDKILFAGFAYGNSNTEYKLATVSKHAILNKKLHAEAFWHAALEVKVRFGDRDVTIVNVHLDPWKEDSREREISRLLATIDRSGPVIITGDLNSLSRQDNYPPSLLDELRAKGISKFGSEALEFRVIDRLLQAGFIDAAAAAGQFDPTVPSVFNTDQDHEVPVRVDYVFVTPDLAPFISRVERVKNDLTDAIADHYPLVVTFDFPGPVAETGPAATPATVVPPLPGPAPLPPASTPPAALPPKQPPKPWVPEPDEPLAAPKPAEPDDGEVVVWSHEAEK